MFNDNAQVIDDERGLIDLEVPVFDADGNPVYELDENGEIIRDENNNPIPVLTFVTTQPTLSVNAALNSPRFFQLFDSGGSHQGWLTPVELKLIAEWLDIGGQYYNNPFDVPQN